MQAEANDRLQHSRIILAVGALVNPRSLNLQPNTPAPRIVINGLVQGVQTGTPQK